MGRRNPTLTEMLARPEGVALDVHARELRDAARMLRAKAVMQDGDGGLRWLSAPKLDEACELFDAAFGYMERALSELESTDDR